MKKTTQILVTQVHVNEIVFYSRDEISLIGFLYKDGRFYEMEYIIENRKVLHSLLVSNETGVEMLWYIVNLFVLPHSVPVQIDLGELFGVTQVFEAAKIVLGIAFKETDTGELKACEENELFFIDEVKLDIP